MPLVRKPAPPPPIAARASAEVSVLLATGSDEERWTAARAAADSPDGATRLGEALQSEHDPRVREAILTSLARIGTAQSAQIVIPLLRSDDAQRRTAALDTLKTMRDAVRPFLPELLADADPDVRLLVCEIVRDFPGDEPAALLARLLENEHNPNVCAAAVEVLAENGGPAALPALAICEERFRDTPFLAFSIKIAADRIRSQSGRPRV